MNALQPTAVVTGSGSGIGRQTAVLLGKRGLHVLCAGRTAASLEETAALIEAAGGTSRVVVVDCGSDAGRAALVEAAAELPVSAFVHSAGADRIKPFAETTRDDLDALVAINLAAPFFLVQALLPRFVDGAGVVFVGSVSAQRGMMRHAAYGATKAALTGLTVNLAAELGPRIRVNCVSPGATDTVMLADFIERSRDGLSEKAVQRQQIAAASRNLLRRLAAPLEVAATIVHLALDATAVTGVDLPVDLGYTAS
jgi:NAD(P)-dependent dehydrogenase (short-subunit alcohol dehydrogenase family)